jgi:hypothetical protein
MMTRRGRPRGSGYDDAGRIAHVRRAMATGLTRRAAILMTCGHDQLRRMEMKMTAADVSEARGKRIAHVVRATLDGMGCDRAAVTVTRMRLPHDDPATMTAMESEARRLGYSLIVRAEELGSPA